MDETQKSKEQLEAELVALRSELADSRRALDELKDRHGRLDRTKHLQVAESIAGQIAHDFNNLLTPLVAYPSLIRNDLPEGTLGRESLDLLEKAAKNMVRITQRLLALSSRRHIDKRAFSINEVVQGALALLQPAANVKVQTHLSAAPLTVLGADDQVQEAIRNLAQNAMEAMEAEGGTVTIKTETVSLSTPLGEDEKVVAGEYVKVTISDNGPGIPEEVKDRIFDPFVTTRRGPKGRGAGLGLSIVHSIVRRHSGYVDVRSETGKGTTFSVYLPAFLDETAGESAEDIRGGTESILIIDDDPTQISIMSKILGRLGYQVAGAHSGQEAIEYVKKNPVDLILLDMVLDPGMDGAQTYRELKAVNPNQRALIVSAYDEMDKVAYAQSLGAGGFIKKVATVESLGKAVRLELDKAQADKPKGAPLRILIVDDEEMIRTLFEMILSSAIPGAQIDMANNGAEAVRAFKEKRHGLLVMDLNMPIMDGREAFSQIEALCREQKLKMPPVVFCTGFAPPDAIKRIVGAGGIHCLLPKPVTEEELLKEVKKRLES